MILNSYAKNLVVVTILFLLQIRSPGVIVL